MAELLPGPGPVLAVVLVTLYVTVFYFLWGKRTLELAVMYPMALLGFALGHMVGELLHTRWLVVGVLHVLEATVGALAFLALAKRVRLPP